MSLQSSTDEKLPSEWSDICQKKSNLFSSEHVSSLIPKLSATAHKGSHGRVAIFGGSEKYTGAPYYAASAALSCGVDLATIFCAQEASIPIKCYSPELMVQSVYSVEELDKVSREDVELTAMLEKEENNEQFQLAEKRKHLRNKQQRSLEKTVSAVTAVFPSLHALCIGPGMGRHKLLFPAVSVIIEKAIECNLSLVLDADALYMLSLDEYRDLLFRLIKYEKVVMTPNLMEFRRLKDTFQKANGQKSNKCTIVQKGSSDIITQQPMTLECKEKGGLKRSGGIGDVLAGVISAFIAWNTILRNDFNENKYATPHQDRLLATWTACCAVKKATCRAFERKARTMSAQHVLEDIGDVIKEMEEDLECEKQ